MVKLYGGLEGQVPPDCLHTHLSAARHGVMRLIIMNSNQRPCPTMTVHRPMHVQATRVQGGCMEQTLSGHSFTIKTIHANRGSYKPIWEKFGFLNI